MKLDINSKYTDEEIVLMHRIVARHYGEKRKESNKEKKCVSIGIEVHHRTMLEEIADHYLMDRLSCIDMLVNKWVDERFPNYTEIINRQLEDGSFVYYSNNVMNFTAKVRGKSCSILDKESSHVRTKHHTLPIHPAAKQKLQHIAIEIETPVSSLFASIVEEEYKNIF